MLRQVLTVPARKIIQNSNRMAFAQQRMYQMRADEPSAAGHEKTSHPKSLKLLKKLYSAMFSVGRGISSGALCLLSWRAGLKTSLVPRAPVSLRHLGYGSMKAKPSGPV